MKYANTQDIIDRYGVDELYTVADRDGDDVLEHSAIDRSLDDASRLIDGYIATRHELPLIKAPAILTRLCVDIAVYLLGQSGGAATDERRLRYEDAIKYLAQVSSGQISLGIHAGPSAIGGGGVVMTSEKRQFSRAILRGL